MAATKNKQKKKKSNSNLYILLALVLSLLAYGAVYFQDKIFKPAPPKQTSAAKPWYKEHTQVPEMIRLPDAPLILASKDAEIDETIQELVPKKPLKKKAKPAPKPRLNNVEVAAKPTPPKQVVFYEEALPNDVYTPVITVSKPKQNKVLNTTPRPSIVQTPELKPRWLQHALKISVPNNKPMIALVIDDLGLDRKRTKRTLDLPGPMTMAFIPYSKKLKEQADMATQKGHELLLHLPMEPLNDKIDAGPNHLNTHLAKEDLLDRIHWNLERFDGYVGVNNHMGSRATTDETVMGALMAELRNREMLFLDSRTNAKSVGAKMANLEGVPYAERNVFLDNVNEKGAVLKQLSLLEKVSKRSGFAVGIGHPRDGTIAALKEWLPTAEGKGFVLVPISQIVMKKQGLS
ncbi:divergent polysaccharide deacetylase family protein [Terasakiella sp. A23]|uniref:divergent polysaccharide deacetylase family protein n=1 Tax=Terasakiella sp. FCG-A23 TaxID=3080561 RepID=UPI0029532B01|nr:divergent polysaccharide deacetylase family protein [Terasakiella sp. A23]MDV7338891.1 divergent polysaccharide deacetylase family protein [Terasakiella sp. A23]